MYNSAMINSFLLPVVCHTYDSPSSNPDVDKQKKMEDLRKETNKINFSQIWSIPSQMYI